MAKNGDFALGPLFTVITVSGCVSETVFLWNSFAEKAYFFAVAIVRENRGCVSCEI